MPAKQSPAPSADQQLADAIRDAGTAVAERVGSPAPSTEPVSKGDQDDKRRASVLSDALKNAKDDHPPDDVAPEPVAEVIPDKKPIEKASEGYAPEDIEIDDVAASPKVREKMKAFKARDREQIKLIQDGHKALQALNEELKAIKEAKKADPVGIDEIPEVKAIRKELEETRHALGRASLADTKEFQEKYDVRMSSAISEIKPILESMDDQGEVDKVRQEIYSALYVSGGDANNGQFYKAVKNLCGPDSPIPDAFRPAISQALMNYRRILNEKVSALADWEKTREKVDGDISSKRVTEAGGTVRSFDGVAQSMEETDELVKTYRGNESIYKYSEIIDPHLKIIREEIPKAAKAGKLTVPLLQYLYDGAKSHFIVDQNRRIVHLFQELYKELDERRKKDKASDSSDPGRSGKPASGQKVEKRGSGYAIVDALREIEERGE